MAISSSLSADQAIRQSLEALPIGYWEFANANTKEWTHGYHSYPAMMIPQVARSLIGIVQQHQPGIRSLFDPFMGSGTSLVEGLLAGLTTVGSDLNPLSRLITQAKTTAWDPAILHSCTEMLMKFVANLRISEADWPNFDNLRFWFKPPVITELTRLRRGIETTVPDAIRPFFWVAFSETVRWVSNSRNAEFKLYRMDETRLAQWNPDVLGTFRKVILRNEKGNRRLWQRRPLPSVSLHAYNAMDLSALPEGAFDLMLTSPPYGDSRTTVAYGQFSRLSLQWLDLADAANGPAPNKLDQAMLGGVATKALQHVLPSPTLTMALDQIAEADVNRAREVLSFYQDLDITLREIARVMRPGGYQCWVVGNRTVKKVRLLTDQIITELSEQYGLIPVVNVSRAIPMKRMPKENSPTNQIGAKMTTINGEQILILRKL
jgi:site-specific DNA-methyltransferase (cytosine-N4-specific)